MAGLNKRETREKLTSLGFRPNRRLGQNFLCSGSVLERIVEATAPCPGETVLEIGPGLGFLTEALAARGARVTAVEIDAGFFRYLSGLFPDGSVSLHHADFLKIILEDDFNKSVSNLPYYCASEILFRLGERYRMGEVYIMLQKEMAERICAVPGTENYGAMTVTLNLYFEPERLFDIDRSCFFPEPEVKSTFLKLTRRDPGPDERTLELFHALVKSAFWGRRKTLASALVRSPHLRLEKDLALEACRAAGIDASLRGENLTLEDFLRLAGIIKEYGIVNEDR